VEWHVRVLWRRTTVVSFAAKWNVFNDNHVKDLLLGLILLTACIIEGSSVTCRHFHGFVHTTKLTVSWRESVRPLLFFCSWLPLTYIIHQRRLLYWKKYLFSDNVLLQTLARCCYDNIGSLCGIYKFTVKNLVDSPKHLVKELFWREFERRSHILWRQCIIFMLWFVFDCVFWFYVLLCFAASA